MSSLIINGGTTFGALTQQLVDAVALVNALTTRLEAAVATAASGFTPVSPAVSGVEYEAPSNFGVAASTKPGDPAGTAGTVYAYQVNGFATNWATFYAANAAYMNQLDNGA